MALIDSHTHFDEICSTGIIEVMIKHKITPISLAFINTPPESIEAFSAYFEQQRMKCQSVKQKGILVYRLIGIHPRSIPTNYKKMEDIEEQKINKILTQAIKHNDVIGIGEIGLEIANDIEKKMFKIQLKFAKGHNLPVCIHTPRKNKESVTKEVFNILHSINLNPNKVLIDHVINDQMLEEVLKNLYYAGITISNSKSSLQDAVAMIKKHKKNAGRIMINSDALTYNPEEYQMFLSVEKHLDKETSHVLEQTAKRFYNLPK